MEEFMKKNAIMVIAFALPVVLVAVVALSTYLPSLFFSTDYNFLYSSCTEGAGSYSYDCNNYLQNRYTVVNNALAVNPIDPLQDADKNGVPDVKKNYTVHIFLHDTRKNESKEITFEEAQRLQLDGLLTSPDGVTISNDYERGADFFFIFGGNSSYNRYLTKGRSKSKLNLINPDDQYYYRNNFQFIGWVLPGRT